jgi:membrane-associated phospholipid phosphatase
VVDRLRRHPVAARVRAFDESVERAVAGLRNPALDWVFYPISSAADHSLLWLALGAVREATGHRRHAGSAVRLAAVLGVESAVTNGLVKSGVGRRRPPPSAPDDVPLPWGLHRPITTAFPSGHATSAFTAAAFLSKGDPLGPAYYALAVVVAASRVYVGLHHASDVLAGVAIGAVFGRIARRFA